MPGAGRPKLPSDVRRERSILVRVTAADYAVIEAAATWRAATGDPGDETVTGYVRARALEAARKDVGG